MILDYYHRRTSTLISSTQVNQRKESGTYIENDIELKFNIGRSHLPSQNRYEFGIVQYWPSSINDLLSLGVVFIIDDLEGIVEYKIIRDNIVPAPISFPCAVYRLEAKIMEGEQGRTSPLLA